MFSLNPPMPIEPLKKWFIVFTGLSGAGKDTASQRVLASSGSAYKAEVVKFSKPMKLAIACLLNVPVEKLEDREYRDTLIPELGVTPLELMVRSFEFLPALHPNICVYNTDMYVRSRVKEAQDLHHVLVFNDVRQRQEAALIANLKDSFGYNLLHIDVKHPVATPLSSDVNYPEVIDYLGYYSDRSYNAYNYWDIQTLHNKIGRILNAVSLLA